MPKIIDIERKIDELNGEVYGVSCSLLSTRQQR